MIRLLLVLAAAPALLAQQSTADVVRGHVTSDSGKTLVGATVVVTRFVRTPMKI